MRSLTDFANIIIVASFHLVEKYLNLRHELNILVMCIKILSRICFREVFVMPSGPKSFLRDRYLIIVLFSPSEIG